MVWRLRPLFASRSGGRAGARAPSYEISASRYGTTGQLRCGLRLGVAELVFIRF